MNTINGMAIPITGIGQLFAIFVFFVVASRFYRYWQRRENLIARSFAYYFCIRGLAAIMLGIPSLLLIRNDLLWRINIPLFLSINSGSGLILSWLLGYIRFPKYTRYIVGLLFLITLVATVTLFVYPPSYFFVGGILVWEFATDSPLMTVMGIHALVYYLGICIPLAILFFQQATRTKIRNTRIKAIGLGLTVFLGIFPIMLDIFIMSFFPNTNPIYSDLSCFFANLLLLITILATWGPPEPKYVTKV